MQQQRGIQVLGADAQIDGAGSADGGVRQADGHVVALKYGGYCQQFVPGLGDRQVHFFKDVGPVEHHQIGLGQGQGVDAVFVGVRHHGILGKAPDHFFVALKLAQIGQGISAGQIDGLASGAVNDHIRGVAGQAGFHQAALHHIDIHVDTVFFREFQRHIPDDLCLVQAAVDPNGDGVVAVFVVLHGLVIVGESGKETADGKNESLPECAIGAGQGIFLGVEGEIVDLQRLLSAFHQPVGYHGNIVPEGGQSVGNFIHIFGKICHSLRDPEQNCGFIGIDTVDTGQLLGGGGQTGGQRCKALGNIGNFPVQIIVMIGVGVGAGDHDDSAVEGIHFRRQVADIQQDIRQGAGGHFEGDDIFAFMEIDIIRFVALPQGELCPLGRVGENHVFKFSAGDLSVNINVPADGHTDAFALPVFDGQTVQTRLLRLYPVGDPHAGFCPGAAADHITANNNRVIGVGGHIGPVGDGINSLVGFLEGVFSLGGEINIGACDLLIALPGIFGLKRFVGGQILLSVQRKLTQDQALTATNGNGVLAGFQNKTEGLGGIACIVGSLHGLPLLQALLLGDQIVTLLVLGHTACIAPDALELQGLRFIKGNRAVNEQAIGQISGILQRVAVAEADVIVGRCRHLYPEGNGAVGAEKPAHFFCNADCGDLRRHLRQFRRQTLCGCGNIPVTGQVAVIICFAAGHRHREIRRIAGHGILRNGSGRTRYIQKKTQNQYPRQKYPSFFHTPFLPGYYLALFAAMKALGE